MGGTALRFRAEHRFSAEPGQVAAVLVDPGFYRDLVLPDVGPPDVLAVDDDPARPRTVRLRYVFVGQLDGLAKRLLGGRQLAWVQQVQLDTSGHTGTLSFEAQADPRRLHGSARFTLTPDAEATVRRIEGELVVAVPGVGAMAERRIVPGLLRRLDIEAQALDARLAS